MRASTMLSVALLVVSARVSLSQTHAPDGIKPPVPHLTLSFATIDCTPGASYTTATGINNAGKVVGSCGGLKGYEWSTNFVRLIDVPGAVGTIASDINSLGEIAGFYDLPKINGARGFRLGKNAYTAIDDAEGIQTVVIGINATGETVGYWNDSNYGIHGFLYSGGYFDPISVPGSLYTIPNGLNSSAVVGIYSISGTVPGFLLEQNVLTTLDFPSAIYSYAYSINTWGEVIGLYEDRDYHYHGFLWQNGSFVATFDLQSGGMEPDVFTRLSLNDRGKIVGTYVDDSGARHGFLANLPKLN